MVVEVILLSQDKLLMDELCGGIEAGGTKFICAVGDDRGNIFESIVIPTEKLSLTMPRIFDFFRNAQLRGVNIKAIG